jgi:hypothetical protein
MQRVVGSTASAVSILLLLSLASGLGGCSRQESSAEGVPSAAPAGSAAQDTPAEREAIRQALHQQVQATKGEKAADDLRIVQIGIDSDYALATWLRGNRGGQAVLQRQGGTWKVVSRDRGWYGIQGLREVDVPERVAKQLLDQVDPNWASYESKL